MIPIKLTVIIKDYAIKKQNSLRKQKGPGRRTHNAHLRLTVITLK